MGAVKKKQKKTHSSSSQTARDNVFLPGFRGGRKRWLRLSGPIFERRGICAAERKPERENLGRIRAAHFLRLYRGPAAVSILHQTLSKSSLTCTDMLAELGVTRKRFPVKCLGWQKSSEVEKVFRVMYLSKSKRSLRSLVKAKVLVQLTQVKVRKNSFFNALNRFCH